MTAPLFRLPFGAVFPNSIAAPAIGAALGALDAFREQSRARINVRDGSRLSEDPFTQFRLAESAAEIDGAYHRMRDNMREMMALASAGEEIPLTRRARYRWDSAKAVDWSVRAVSRLMEASGGRGIFLDEPDPARLARCPCDARPYRQQPRARRRRLRPLRVRPAADRHPVLDQGPAPERPF